MLAHYFTLTLQFTPDGWRTKYIADDGTELPISDAFLVRTLRDLADAYERDAAELAAANAKPKFGLVPEDK